MNLFPNLQILTGIALLVWFQSVSCAAALCVQSNHAGRYQADDPATDCSTRAPVKFPVAKAPEALAPAAIAGFSDYQTSLANASEANSRWELRAEDGSVYAALNRWSVLAGWQMSWEIPVDFPVEIEDAASGSYESAVRRILTAFRVSDYPPHPCFHVNRVLRVVRRIQGNDDECK